MTLRTPLRSAVATAAVATLALGLTACGASTSDSESPSSGGSTTPASDLSEEARAAQAVLDEYTAVPTEIRQKTPLPEAPPQGEKIVWLNCDIPTCTTIGAGVENAMEAAGWEYEQINYQSANPATLTAAFKQALQLDPTAVAVSGVPPEAGWSAVIPDYQAAGVPIIASFIGTAPEDLPEGVVANIAGPEVFDEYAKQVANWFIADSNAQGKALIHRIDAFPILKSFADSMVGYIEAGCTECDIDAEVQNSAADAGSQKIVPSVVSALKREADVDYLLTCDLEFFDPLPSALAAAGREDVKVAGQNPTLAGLGLVQTGKFAMAPSHPTEQAGWIIADVAFRSAMDLEIPDDVNQMPTHLLLPGGDFVTDELVDEPTDFADQFKALWQLG